MIAEPLEILSGFIATLLDRRRHLDERDPLLLSLILSQGLLLRQQAARQGRHLNHQSLVLGPTQAGKSTLVNLLLGGDCTTGGARAGASPLAGYTRHAQGFGDLPTPDAAELLHQLLPGFKQIPRSDLDPDILTSYSLSEAQATRPGLLWDTPDFDSVHARHYRFNLPAFCALADLLILVVSKEKYADQSVWEMLKLLLAANIPLGLVVNKVPKAESTELCAIIARRFAAEGLACPEIFTLPWLNPAEPTQLATSPGGQGLLDWYRRSGQISLTSQGLAALLERHWQPWTAELRRELASRVNWQGLIDHQGAELGAGFRRDYLDNQTYAETKGQVLAELLKLLELPGMGKAMVRIRGLLTWPIRTLADRLSQGTASESQHQSGEETLLREESHRLIHQLLSRVMAETGQHQGRERDWWQQLWQALNREEPRLQRLAADAILAHQQAFQPEIKATANALLEHLKQDPIRLNGLRTARATTEAAALAIPFLTGGVGWMDFALSPLILAFSSLLTEGVAGQYLNGLLEELKARQLTSVETRLLGPLRQALLELTSQIPADSALGISAEELEAAEAALEVLK
jgi:GTPase SAR1 family protein